MRRETHDIYILLGEYMIVSVKHDDQEHILSNICVCINWEGNSSYNMEYMNDGRIHLYGCRFSYEPCNLSILSIIILPLIIVSPYLSDSDSDPVLIEHVDPVPLSAVDSALKWSRKWIGHLEG
jgi:hypothetical protein